MTIFFFYFLRRDIFHNFFKKVWKINYWQIVRVQYRSMFSLITEPRRFFCCFTPVINFSARIRYSRWLYIAGTMNSGVPDI